MGPNRKPGPQAPSYKVIRGKLHRLADPVVARSSQRFFKTGPGEYGAGDRFLGIGVPRLRKLVPDFQDATLATVTTLLESEWHEERLFALLLLARQYALGDKAMRNGEDLIHKAVGWMLREIGNRDPAAERSFLDVHAAHMPRTMLRYAIEKFPARERARYMKEAR